MLSLMGLWMLSLSAYEQFGNGRNTSFSFPELWVTEMNLSVYVSIHCNTVEREIILKSDSVL